MWGWVKLPVTYRWKSSIHRKGGLMRPCCSVTWPMRRTVKYQADIYVQYIYIYNYIHVYVYINIYMYVYIYNYTCVCLENRHGNILVQNWLIYIWCFDPSTPGLCFNAVTSQCPVPCPKSLSRLTTEIFARHPTTDMLSQQHLRVVCLVKAWQTPLEFRGVSIDVSDESTKVRV